MKRVLLINQNWLAIELKELGHEVTSVGLGETACDLHIQTPELPFEEILGRLPFRPEVIVWLDDSGVTWFPGLENSDIPKIFFSIDVHHHHHWHAHHASMFDLVLFAQKDFGRIFSPYCLSAEWWPLWSTTTPEVPTKKTYDVSFVGTLDPVLHPKRALFFDELRKYVPIHVQGGDYTKIYPLSKIVVNQTVEGDLNYRVFEAMSSGALLVTPLIGNGLFDLFTPGVELVVYERDNPKDAAEKLTYYLQHDDERVRIARAGFEAVRAQHTNGVRAEELSRMIEGLKPGEKAYRYFGGAVSYLASFMVCQHQKLNWGKGMLRASAECLLKSAAVERHENRDYRSTVVIVKHLLEENGESDMALQFLRLILDSYPNDLVMKLALVQSFVKRGEKAEAIKLAQSFSAEAQEVVAQIDRHLASALSKA